MNGYATNVMSKQQPHHNDSEITQTGMPADYGEVVDRRSGIDRRDLYGIAASKDLGPKTWARAT